jgi:hypothetical protein
LDAPSPVNRIAVEQIEQFRQAPLIDALPVEHRGSVPSSDLLSPSTDPWPR